MEIKKFALLIIIFIGFLLRTANIQINPPALYGDELTIALDAYSLLETGHDQLGNFLPLTFPMGAGRPAGYVYGSIPFVAFFGPTALGVRSLSILSGIGIILLLYLLGRQFFSEKLGIVAGFAGAVSPWDLSLSRGGFEAHFALFLALLGIYLFFAAKQKLSLYIFSALSFGLSLHTYPTYKVSLFVFLPLLFWYANRGREILKNRYFLTGIVTFTVLGILALSQTFLGGSEIRFADINILSQGKLKSTIEQKINLERQINNLPTSLIKYFHNKPIEYSKVFVENYLQNFSLDFLVLHGDRNPRHNMGTQGVLYAVEIILISLGILTLWQKYKRELAFFMLWIFVAPIPSALIDFPHALRSSFMLPPLILLSAVGLMNVLNYRDRKLLGLLSIVFLAQFIFFIQRIYFLSPNEYGNFWSFPARLAAEMAIRDQDGYNYIILSSKIDNIEFAFPVYAKIPADQIIDQNKKPLKFDTYTFKKYGNVYISYLPDNEVSKFIEGLREPVLYITSPSSKNYLDDYESIIGPDGKIILILKKILR